MKKLLLSLLVLANLNSRAEDIKWTKAEVNHSGLGIRATGRIIPQDGALNFESASVPGRIVSILKREGESVAPGTLLFSVNSAECFSLQEERRVAASREIPELVAAVDLREKQMGLLVKEGACFVISAHSGVITKRNIESGATFNPGDLLVTIIDGTKLTVELDLPEGDLTKIERGQRVKFQLAAAPKEAIESKIVDIVPTIDPTTRTSKVRLDPRRLPAWAKVDGLVFAEIQTKTAGSTLNVPSSALVFDHNKEYVIKKVNDQKTAVQVEVVGESQGWSHVRAIEDNQLKAGDEVAASGGIFAYRELASLKQP